MALSFSPCWRLPCKRERANVSQTINESKFIYIGNILSLTPNLSSRKYRMKRHLKLTRRAIAITLAFEPQHFVFLLQLNSCSLEQGFKYATRRYIRQRHFQRELSTNATCRHNSRKRGAQRQRAGREGQRKRERETPARR